MEITVPTMFLTGSFLCCPANSPGITKIMPPPTSALRACKPKPCTHKGDDWQSLHPQDAQGTKEKPKLFVVHFVRPAFEVRTETDLSEPDLTNDLHLRKLHDFLQFGRLDVRNIFVCAFGPSDSVATGSVPSATTGMSTIVSVNFHSFLCLLRCWHLHQDFRNPSQRIEYDISSAFCTVRIGWNLATWDVPQLAHQ